MEREKTKDEQLDKDKDRQMETVHQGFMRPRV
jgi:hypothetical protein